MEKFAAIMQEMAISLSKHADALKGEREAFRANTDRLIASGKTAVKIFAAVSALLFATILACAFILGSFILDAARTAESVSARLDATHVDVLEARNEAREAREAAEEAPRIEVAPAAPSASARTLVLVAPVARKPGAPAPPAPSASVPITVGDVPLTVGVGP